MQAKDRVLIGPNIVFGEVVISAATLQQSGTVRGTAPGWYLIKPNHQEYATGMLEFEVSFTACSGENDDPIMNDCYFTAHKNCRHAPSLILAA